MSLDYFNVRPFHFMHCYCILSPPPSLPRKHIPSQMHSSIRASPVRFLKYIYIRSFNFRVHYLPYSVSALNQNSLRRELRDIVPSIPEPSTCSKSKSKLSESEGPVIQEIIMKLCKFLPTS